MAWAHAELAAPATALVEVVATVVLVVVEVLLVELEPPQAAAPSPSRPSTSTDPATRVRTISPFRRVGANYRPLEG